MIDLSTTRKQPEAQIFSWEFHSDLDYGISMLALTKKDHPNITVTSDASSSWSAAFLESHWFQLQWSGAASSAHIAVQKLIPIALAAALWDHSWFGKTVRDLSDNLATLGLHYKFQGVS